jgi:hypothetical protein
MDLAGKVVGLLDNTKERVVIKRKEHYSKPATEALINEMAQEVEVAVAAVGG